MALALVVAAIGLAVYETLPVTMRSVTPAIKDHLQKTSQYRFVAMQIDRRARPPRLRVVVEGPSAAVPNLVKEIAIIARRNGLNDEFRVEIETHIITSSDDSRVDLINAVDSNRIAPEGGVKSGLQLNASQQ